MVNYFYDCEFIEDGKTIELISIGIVSDDGREYYAVNRDMDIDKILKNPWLYENVWCNLPLTPLYAYEPESSKRIDQQGRTLDEYDTAVKIKTVLIWEVLDFITRNGELDHEEISLWAYYGAYDHVVLCQLFGAMLQLPSGIPMYTNELMQLWSSVGCPIKPDMTGKKHNALEDAKWNYELWKVCNGSTS